MSLVVAFFSIPGALIGAYCAASRDVRWLLAGTFVYGIFAGVLLGVML